MIYKIDHWIVNASVIGLLLMKNIINWDITYYLLKFLYLQDWITLVQTNNSLRCFIYATPLGRELIHFKNKKHLCLSTCIELGYVNILSRLGDNRQLVWPTDALRIVVQNNQLLILDLMVRFHYSFDYGVKILNIASAKGHVAILHWFDTKGYPIKYDCSAVDKAAKNGHLAVLQWWAKSNHPFLYSVKAIDKAADKGHLFVLEWFDKQSYPFKYSCDAVNRAAKKGHLAVIKWFHYSNHPFSYTAQAVDDAAAKGYLDIIVWFFESKYPFLYTDDAVDMAAKNGHLDVIRWFNDNCSFKYTRWSIQWAVKHNRLTILDWFRCSKYPFPHDEVIMSARRYHCTLVLDWLYTHHYLSLS